MSGIYEFKEQDAFDFANFVGIKASPRGKDLVFAKCPYCHNKTKDKEKFAISLTTGQFQCFRASCGVRGNMFTLAKDFNFSLGTEVDDYLSGWSRFRTLPQKKPEPRQQAIEYLLSRGITEEVTKQYNITVTKDHDNVLAFPFYDENDVLCFIKYRKTDFDKERDRNKEWCEKNCKTILFGMNRCDMDYDTLVITEGQIDSLSLVVAGVRNAVSVPTGAKGFTWIPHCWEFLKKFKTIIVFGDYENGEMTLLTEISKRFPGCVKHVRYEDYKGCKDANEILQKHGKEALAEAVDKAVPVEHPSIISLADVERVDLGNMEGISTGLRSLDCILGKFYFGQLILLTGERGEGKSTLASQFGTFALAEGHNVFFYSGELMNWYFKAWFDGQIAGAGYINKQVNTYSGFTSYMVDPMSLSAIERWYRDRVYIYDNGSLNGTDEQAGVLDVMKIAIQQYGCRVLVVDNLMSAMVDDTNLDQYRQQTIFVNALAQMAKRNNVLIFLIAHPRKKMGFTFDNDDVAGSSNITNLVDVVLRYARPKGKDIPADTNERDLTVYKNRLNGRTCRTGIRLAFEESSKRISETNDFDWDLGWGYEDRQMKFEPIAEEDTPFGRKEDQE